MLHVVALPHTQVTREYSACAYTQKVRRFCGMMQDEGWPVTLYASKDNDVDCQTVMCITKKEQRKFGFAKPADYNKMRWDAKDPMWKLFNRRVLIELLDRVQPEDLVCVVSGNAGLPMIRGIQPRAMVVEFGIGYEGVVSGTHKVYESNAWRHYVHGRWNWDKGVEFDTVIPNAYAIKEFPVVVKPDDYFAFAGRLDAAKGLNIAQQACERTGAPLKIAGVGGGEGYGEFLGLLSGPDTIDLMAHALAVFVPTAYIGPFEGVHVEAQLCGTPVLTTDFGVFTETVMNGINGFRCSMFRDYLQGMATVETLSRGRIAAAARARYSTERVGLMYTSYFERLLTLYGNGWYT